MADLPILLDTGAYSFRWRDFQDVEIVLEEQHAANMQVTRHAVERGTDISDHAILLPAELSLKFVLTDTPIDGEPQPGRAIRGYLQLEALQREMVLADVVTGLKVYDNMFLQNIGTVLSVETQHYLEVTAHFVRVNVVDSQTSMASSTGRSERGRQSTSATKQAEQDKPKVTSALKALKDGLGKLVGG